MFDPLSSTSSIFANADDHSTPPWPTTPHSPHEPIPNLRRAPSPSVTTHKIPSDGLFGKEPKIYGAPEPGLISPQTTIGSNGVKFEKSEPYLRVRITGLDRNRRDILFKFDAQVRNISIKPVALHLFGLFRIPRRTFLISPVRHIATFPAHSPSFNNSTTPCSTIVRILSSPLCRLPRPPHPLTKKTIALYESCYRDG